MANFSKTLKTQSVRVFGTGPDTRWGQANGFPYTMTWGTSTWGEGYSNALDFVKVLSQSAASVTCPASAMQFGVIKYVSQSTPISSDMGSEKLSDGSGHWQYVFTSNVNEAERRSFASWTTGAAVATSFTCGAAGSTTWT